MELFREIKMCFVKKVFNKSVQKGTFDLCISKKSFGFGGTFDLCISLNLIHDSEV